MQFLVTTILFLFYVLVFVVNRSATVLFGLLFLLGLAGLVASGKTSITAFGQFARRHWRISVAMAAPLLAVLANLLAAGGFDGGSIDLPSRLAMFVLIFWAVQFAPYRWMQHLQWAFVVGALAAAIKMYLLTGDGQVRYMDDFIPLNVFSGMQLLLGFFAVSTLAWQNRAGFVGMVLKIVSLGAVLYATYLSGTRGVWVIIPVLITIAGIAFFAKGIRLKHIAVGMAICAVCVTLAWQVGGIVRERIAVAESDIRQYTQGSNVDTSLGVRLQLWRGSWIMFKEHPVFGVGVRGFVPALKELETRKIVSPVAATFVHSHNDILFMMAKCGTLGLMAILGLYLVPASMFARRLFSSDKEIRSCAYMGVTLVIGLVIQGLSDAVFMFWEIAPFYVVTTAFLLTYIEKRQQHLEMVR